MWELFSLYKVDIKKINIVVCLYLHELLSEVISHTAIQKVSCRGFISWNSCLVYLLMEKLTKYKHSITRGKEVEKAMLTLENVQRNKDYQTPPLKRKCCNILN